MTWAELDERTGRVVAPLSSFSEEQRAEFARIALLPSPPPRWKRGLLCALPSRAYYEWFAERGIDFHRMRPHLPDWMRARVLERSGRICGICGGEISPEETPHIDHIQPVALGGRTISANLQPAHARCNLSKGARA